MKRFNHFLPNVRNILKNIRLNKYDRDENLWDILLYRTEEIQTVNVLHATLISTVQYFVQKEQKEQSSES